MLELVRFSFSLLGEFEFAAAAAIKRIKIREEMLLQQQQQQQQKQQQQLSYHFSWFGRNLEPPTEENDDENRKLKQPKRKHIFRNLVLDQPDLVLTLWFNFMKKVADIFVPAQL